MQLAGAAVGHVECIRSCEIRDALRLVESCKPAHHFPTVDIDDCDGIVTELGDEQPPVCHIDSQVVDAAFDIA